MRGASHPEPGRRAGLPAVLRRTACLVDQDAMCLDCLDWLRWPDGSSALVAAASPDGASPTPRWLCGLCKRKVSATAGTIFDKTLTTRLTREWTRHIVNSRRSTNTPGLAQLGRATWVPAPSGGHRRTEESMDKREWTPDDASSFPSPEWIRYPKLRPCVTRQSSPP
jgi:hypothetical protein